MSKLYGVPQWICFNILENFAFRHNKSGIWSQVRKGTLFMFPQRVSAFEMQASTCVDLVSIHMALLRANTEN